MVSVMTYEIIYLDAEYDTPTDDPQHPHRQPTTLPPTIHKPPPATRYTPPTSHNTPTDNQLHPHQQPTTPYRQHTTPPPTTHHAPTDDPPHSHLQPTTASLTTTTPKQTTHPLQHPLPPPHSSPRVTVSGCPCNPVVQFDNGCVGLSPNLSVRDFEWRSV